MRCIRGLTLAAMLAAQAMPVMAQAPGQAQGPISDQDRAYCVGAIQVFAANLEATLPPNLPPEIQAQAQTAFSQQRQFASATVGQLTSQLAAERLWPAPPSSPIGAAVAHGTADATRAVSAEKQCIAQCQATLQTPQGGACMQQCMTSQVSGEVEQHLQLCPAPTAQGQ